MKKINYKNSVTLLIVLASLVCILICLIDLNNYFHDSDRLMKVYEVLEKCNDENDYDASQWKEVSSVEIAQYYTFFENLLLLYRHHIASIDDILATVSPDNAPSKRNFIAEGFVVKDTKTKCSGFKRDLMIKQLL